MVLTLKAVKDELAANGLSLTKRDGEYRVAFKGTRRDDTFSEAYFTDGLHDALMTGLVMADEAGTLVTRVPRTLLRPTLADAVEYHSNPVIELSHTLEFREGDSIKTTGGTFRVKANAYGNWYGYQGSKRVEMFWGDYNDQMFDAARWLNTLRQAEVLGVS